MRWRCDRGTGRTPEQLLSARGRSLVRSRWKRNPLREWPVNLRGGLNIAVALRPRDRSRSGEEIGWQMVMWLGVVIWMACSSSGVYLGPQCRAANSRNTRQSGADIACLPSRM